MSEGRKLVNLADLKVPYDKLVPEDTEFRVANRVIQFVEPWRTASARQSGMDYVRSGNRIMLDGTISRLIRIRLYGEASDGTSAYSFVNNNPGCVTFVPGHTYVCAMRLLSGTIAHASGGTHNFSIVKAGTSTYMSSLFPYITITSWMGNSANIYTEFFVPNDATDLVFGLYLSPTNKTTCSNAVFEVTLLDVTNDNPLNASTLAPSESVIAKANHSVGDLILLGGQLYKVTTAFNAGDTIATTMISKTTIAAQIAALRT